MYCQSIILIPCSQSITSYTVKHESGCHLRMESMCTSIRKITHPHTGTLRNHNSTFCSFCWPSTTFNSNLHPLTRFHASAVTRSDKRILVQHDLAKHRHLKSQLDYISESSSLYETTLKTITTVRQLLESQFAL